MEAMQLLSRMQEITADNLANINTPGFKGSTPFQQLLTEQINGENQTRTVLMQQVNLTQGVLEPTGNEFDIGLKGEGFFMVEQDGNSYLTRDGRFHIDSDGYLKNSQGGNVIGSGGAIHIPEYFQAADTDQGEVDFEVAKDGTIRLNNEVYDQLRVLNVDNPQYLERKGGTYFTVADGATVTEDESSTVMQGYYEKGNVEPLQEMVNMMQNSQMFEAQQRAMRSTDETLAQATSSLGRF